MDTPLVIIKTYIPNTRACAIQLNWMLEGMGTPSLSLYLLELAPKSLCVKQLHSPLIVTRLCLGAFKLDANFMSTFYVVG